MKVGSTFGLFSTVFRAVVVISLAPPSIGDRESELRKQALSHYNKSVSPWFEDSPSDVGIYFWFFRILQFDEPTSLLSVEGFLGFNWHDTRLGWKADNATQDIPWVSVNNADIWKQKMNVFNSGRAQQYRYTEKPAFFTPLGEVWWYTSAELHAVCVPEDLRWFPMDIHTCRLQLGSLYPQVALIMDTSKPVTNGVNHRYGLETVQWTLLSLEEEDNFTSISATLVYPTHDFIFTICRQGRPVLAIFLPLMMCCIFLSWSSFILPSRGELLTKRLGIAIFSFYLTSVFLLVLVKKVPGVGHRPPVIVKVYACVIFLEFFTCLHTVLIANIFRRSSAVFVSFRSLPEPVQHMLGIHECGPSGSGKGLLEEEESEPQCVPEQLGREAKQENNSEQVAIACDRVHLFLQVIVLSLASILVCVL